MKMAPYWSVSFLLSSVIFNLFVVFLHSPSLIPGVNSSELSGGPFGVEGGCDSCGKECFKVCGLRSFRACCFNYIKKRSGSTHPILHDMGQDGFDEDEYGNSDNVVDGDGSSLGRNALLLSTKDKKHHNFKHFNTHKRDTQFHEGSRSTSNSDNNQLESPSSADDEEMIHVLANNNNDEGDHIHKGEGLTNRFNPYIRYLSSTSTSKNERSKN